MNNSQIKNWCQRAKQLRETKDLNSFIVLQNEILNTKVIYSRKSKEYKNLKNVFDFSQYLKIDGILKIYLIEKFIEDIDELYNKYDYIILLNIIYHRFIFPPIRKIKDSLSNIESLLDLTIFNDYEIMINLMTLTQNRNRELINKIIGSIRKNRCNDVKGDELSQQYTKLKNEKEYSSVYDIIFGNNSKIEKSLALYIFARNRISKFSESESQNNNYINLKHYDTIIFEYTSDNINYSDTYQYLLSLTDIDIIALLREKLTIFPCMRIFFTKTNKGIKPPNINKISTMYKKITIPSNIGAKEKVKYIIDNYSQYSQTQILTALIFDTYKAVNRLSRRKKTQQSNSSIDYKSYYQQLRSTKTKNEVMRIRQDIWNQLGVKGANHNYTPTKVKTFCDGLNILADNRFHYAFETQNNLTTEDLNNLIINYTSVRLDTISRTKRNDIVIESNQTSLEFNDVDILSNAEDVDVILIKSKVNEYLNTNDLDKLKQIKNVILDGIKGYFNKSINQADILGFYRSLQPPTGISKATYREQLQDKYQNTILSLILIFNWIYESANTVKLRLNDKKLAKKKENANNYEKLDSTKEMRAEYRQTNPDVQIKANLNYRAKNYDNPDYLERNAKNQKAYRHDIIGIDNYNTQSRLRKNKCGEKLKLYKLEAEYRGLLWELDDEYVYQLFDDVCCYCGEPSTEHQRNGIDRVNNDIGYTMDNCVSCCQMCNKIKGCLGYNKFIQRIEHILVYLKEIDGKMYPNVFCDSSSFKTLMLYISSANKRNIDFELSIDEFKQIINGDCYLCGKQNSSSHQNGIDRIDSSLGYTLINCKTCCCECNYMKSSLNYNEFIDKLLQIHNHEQDLKNIKISFSSNKIMVKNSNKLSKDEILVNKEDREKLRKEKTLKKYETLKDKDVFKEEVQRKTMNYMNNKIISELSDSQKEKRREINNKSQKKRVQKLMEENPDEYRKKQAKRKRDWRIKNNITQNPREKLTPEELLEKKKQQNKERQRRFRSRKKK